MGQYNSVDLPDEQVDGQHRYVKSSDEQMWWLVPAKQIKQKEGLAGTRMSFQFRLEHLRAVTFFELFSDCTATPSGWDEHAKPPSVLIKNVLLQGIT